MAKFRGKLVVGQSGGPTMVINQSVVGIIEEAMKHDDFTAIWGAREGVKGILNENFADLAKESPANLKKVACTPGACLGSIRLKPTADDCQQMFDIFKKHDIRFYFYIGGNDSAESANIVNELAADSGYELHVFHIPKTVDNDLCVTDHCPGYGSAARYVGLALMGDNFDNRSLLGIKIDVIMGRDAGFLTAASILCRKNEDDGPHLVYVPEVDFSKEQFVADVDAVYTKYGRCLVAVSEGIHGPNHEELFSLGEVDQFGNKQLSGSGALGDVLAALIREKLGQKLRVRADTFGYMQRAFPGAVSPVDAEEAYCVGQEAVKLAIAGDVDGSVAIKREENGKNYRVSYFRTDLENVARKTKCLDPSCINEAGNNILPEYLDYLTPLVGPVPEPGRLELISAL